MERGSPTDEGRPAGDELVDIVDDDDRVVAVTSRRRMRAERLRHRAVFVVVVRSGDGELLVHRRSAAKDLWPGRWDVAVGGVVGAGERWDDAARRELAEEVGIDAEPVALHDGTYVDADVDVVARCYRVVHDGPISFPDGEVAEARWVDPAGLDALLAQASFVPDSIALLPRRILFPSGPR